MRCVEEASLNAWPALEQILYDGWVLRFSDGYTRRANSINALYDSQIGLEAKIARAEREYTARGLPVVFRLTPFSPSGLDGALASRGYRREAPTLVMLCELADDRDQTSAREAGASTIHEQPVDVWLPGFAAARGDPVSARSTHRAILDAIPGKARGFSLASGDEIVAYALGVVEDACAGLFDVLTASAHRNQGFGSALLRAVLRWARREGARWAYVQVMEENPAARHVYTKLGFGKLYGYWYRVTDRASRAA
jgi:GNAT superfamily N-acetyltransferase